MQDDPSSDDQLINLEAPASKFDTMTLDDLNDDDFDPRAGDQTGPSDQLKKTSGSGLAGVQGRSCVRLRIRNRM